VAIDDCTYLAKVEPAKIGTGSPAANAVRIDGERVLFVGGAAWSFRIPTSARLAATGAAGDGALRSPMPGRVVSVPVRVGQAVKRGEVLIAVEAMKMEHALVAPFDGIVAELQVGVGDQVAENVLLARVARSAGE
jgi:3-methylcrotonyl-CoA carboxylase alpha subunit